jgi:hypothetical protein
MPAAHASTSGLRASAGTMRVSPPRTSIATAAMLTTARARPREAHRGDAAGPRRGCAAQRDVRVEAERALEARGESRLRQAEEGARAPTATMPASVNREPDRDEPRRRRARAATSRASGTAARETARNRRAARRHSRRRGEASRAREPGAQRDQQEIGEE